MFYRYSPTGARIAIDLDGILHDQPMFIVGGAPSARVFNEWAPNDPRPLTLAINNAGTIARPTHWVSGDRPDCYSKSILMNPGIMKFARVVHKDAEVEGKPWYWWPNTYFFGDTEKFTYNNLLNYHKDFAWWKNTFFVALQLAFRLGVRKVYLVGCEFNVNKADMYAWEADLKDEEVMANRRLYNQSVRTIERLQRHFEDVGFEVISCTPASAANAILEERDLLEVLKEVNTRIPDHATRDLPHSMREKSDEGTGVETGASGSDGSPATGGTGRTGADS